MSRSFTVLIIVTLVALAQQAAYAQETDGPIRGFTGDVTPPLTRVQDATDDAWKTMAGSGCGGNGQVPCYRWTSCAWRDPIFNRCIPGYVLDGPYHGCDNDRLNNYVVVCGTCGRNGAPLCVHGAACDPRHNNIGLCVPCGSDYAPLCWQDPVCDIDTRINGLLCTPSGFSEEPDCACSVGDVPPQTPGEPLKGIADIHTHQFSNLGFGGSVFWGAPFHPDGINKALAWCDFTWHYPMNFLGIPMLHPTLGFMIHGNEIDQAVEYLVSASANTGEGIHSNRGTGSFAGWPTYKTTTHQQMYYKWLERAYKGGLRLFVMLAVNNEVLCKLSRTRYGFSCDDMFAVDKQLEATKQLEVYVDLMDDGIRNYTGWYKIAYSAAQAREIIEGGDMAVVLGIEVDALFGCKPNSTHCNETYLKSEVERYYNKGVRHIFPVHLFDNRFSGATLYTDFFTIANFIATGGEFMDPWDCSDYPTEETEKYDYKTVWVDVLLRFYEILLVVLPPLPDYGPIDAHCNSRGLSDEGRTLINILMDQKMIVDVDHLSLLAMDEVFDIAEARSYPLVSGHAFLFDYPEMPEGHHELTEMHKTKAQIHRIRDLGGVVAPLNPRQKCSDTGDYIDIYRYIVEEMSGGPFYEEGYPGIAFASDWGGMFMQTAPRFGPEAEGCDDYDADAPRLDYRGGTGFEAVGGFGRFRKQQTGQRTFDFNTDGLAHVGLLPDFFADLLVQTTTDDEGNEVPLITAADLDPLLNSAETFIRMWERIDNRRIIPPPTVTAQIDGTRGSNGWYTSDVTITFDVTAVDPIVWDNGCEPVAVTEDTPGITFTCQASTEGGQSQVTVTIKKDTVPPVITGIARLTPEPASGWTNQPVIVAFSAMDELSGIQGHPYAEQTIFREGEDMSLSHTFIDAAGHTTSATYEGINIDVTAPMIGFMFAHLPPDITPEEYEAERLRWHNEDVVFIVDAIDALSGIDTVVPPELVLSQEGAAVQGGATATDLAGNSITLLSPPVRIDKTPPSIEFVSRMPGPNQHGWNNEDITVTWACQDGLSGVIADTVDETLTEEGADLSLTGQCEDEAGNITEHTVGALYLDKTAPEIFIEAMPPANPAGWNNTDVTVAFNATDQLSGVDGDDVWSTVLSDEAPDQSVTYGFTDRAGNSTSETITGINIDKTPPVVECQASPVQLWPPNRRMIPVTVAMTFSDELSGPASFSLTTLECTATRTAVDVGDWAGDVDGFELGLDVTTGLLRAQRGPKGQGRVYTLEYTGLDVADNPTTCTTTVTVPPNMGRGQPRGGDRLPATP